MQFDIATTTQITKYPWRNLDQGNSVWNDFWDTRPIYPAAFPDLTKPSYAEGGGTGGAHIVSDRDLSGYNDNDKQNVRGSTGLKYNFNAINGLSAKAFVSFSLDYGAAKNFSKPVNYFKYDYASDVYTAAGTLGASALTQSKSMDRMITQQYSLDYNNVLVEDHQISVLALFEAIDYYSDNLTAYRKNFLTTAIDQLFAGSSTGMTNNGSAAEMGRESVVGRLNYGYRNRYLLETSIRADASAKFSTKSRWGYFPSILLGWRLSKENFMDKFEAVDELKLKASYGASGNDNVLNFQYLTGYNLGTYATGGNYLFGSSAAQGVVSTGIANPDLTWEQINIYNTGLEFSFWNSKLYGETDAFYRERSGIPATRTATLPSSFGAGLPQENLNVLNDRGFELQIGTRGENNGFRWDISGNISWSRSKWDHFEEPIYTDPEQERISKVSGRWTDRQFGYVSDGLFTSQDQINNLGYDQDLKGNSTLRPGDIKYKDMNGDLKIDWKDQVEIGKGTIPHWMVGLSTDLKYKNFDLSFLFQGALGFYKYLDLNARSNLSELVYKLRWNEQNNNANAVVSRLGGSSLNGLVSDYYYVKSDYIRLKSITLGYSIPESLLNRYKIKQLRIYTSAYNLLTFSGLTKYETDPEAPSGLGGFYYPQQRTITFGINVSF